MSPPRRRPDHLPAQASRRAKARRRQAPPQEALPRASARPSAAVRGARRPPPPNGPRAAAPAGVPGGVRGAPQVSLRGRGQANARPRRHLDPSPMNEEARIAVLIPCYRDAELAVEAVRSIQENEPVEVIVIDDHSELETNDAVLQRLEADGITVLRHDDNLGCGAARDTGRRAASAPYIFPLDADDLAAPGMLARMADRLDA